jgi:hypothetical protein
MKQLLFCNSNKVIAPFVILLCLSFSYSSVFPQSTPVAYKFLRTPSNPTPQNEIVDSTLYDDQRCSDLYHKGGSYANLFQFRNGYDTLKHYIEHCYMDSKAGPTFRGISNMHIACYPKGIRYGTSIGIGCAMFYTSTLIPYIIAET